MLLTRDRGYLRASLAEHGVTVREPGGFLADTFGEQPSAVLRTLEEQAKVWGGGHPLNELLDAIERAGSGRLADLARAASSDPGTEP
ncbi:MAG: hypothetical protein J2O48_02045 [Solirubrobacterales bacterium]|nr:hypothetical protein [Solirubrobacterales bacterium]